MRAIGLSHTSEEATRRALKYWSEHWDLECPTLFGIEREQLCAVLASWPSIVPGTEERAAQAIIGAYRELLHGASSVRRSAVEATIGVTYEQACSLLEELCVLMQSLHPAANDA